MITIVRGGEFHCPMTTTEQPGFKWHSSWTRPVLVIVFSTLSRIVQINVFPPRCETETLAPRRLLTVLVARGLHATELTQFLAAVTESLVAVDVDEVTACVMKWISIKGLKTAVKGTTEADPDRTYMMSTGRIWVCCKYNRSRWFLGFALVAEKSITRSTRGYIRRS